MAGLQKFLARLRLRTQGESNNNNHQLHPHPQPQVLENTHQALARYQTPPTSSSSPPPSYKSPPPAYAAGQLLDLNSSNGPPASNNSIDLAGTMADRSRRVQANSATMADSAARSARAGANSGEGTTANLPAPASGTTPSRPLPHHRQRRKLNTIITVPVKEWPLFLLPVLVWAVNIILVVLGCLCGSFYRDYTSEEEAALMFVYSYPKKANFSLLAMAMFGFFVGLLHLALCPCSVLRRYNYRGFMSGLYFLLLIWVLAEMSLYANLESKAEYSFDGKSYFHACFSLTVVEIVFLAVYMCWPGNSLTYQRVANAPGPGAWVVAVNPLGFFRRSETNTSPPATDLEAQVGTQAVRLNDIASHRASTPDSDAIVPLTSCPAPYRPHSYPADDGRLSDVATRHMQLWAEYRLNPNHPLKVASRANRLDAENGTERTRGLYEDRRPPRDTRRHEWE